MPRAYSCLTALSVAAAVHGLAPPGITARAVIAQRGNDCPYLSVSHADSSTSIQGCCVGGSNEGQQPFLSVCKGWPICDGNPTTTTWTATPISCAAMIAYTNANYDAELSSAEKAFSADSTNFCYTVGGADNCAGGSAANTATTTSAAASASAQSGDTDVGATGSDAAATGGTAIGSAGTAGSAVNSGNGANATGTSQSGSSGNSSSSSFGSSGSSSSSSSTSTTSGSGSSSSSSLSSSSSSTTTMTVTSTTAAAATTTATSSTTSSSSSSSSSSTSGANVLGFGWGVWALGLAGVGPVVMAVML